MTLNSSGPIVLAGNAPPGQNIALELGLPTTAQISLNDPAVRALAQVPSGQIRMPQDFWGKANAYNISFVVAGAGGGGGGDDANGPGGWGGSGGRVTGIAAVKSGTVFDVYVGYGGGGGTGGNGGGGGGFNALSSYSGGGGGFGGSGASGGGGGGGGATLLMLNANVWAIGPGGGGGGGGSWNVGGSNGVDSTVFYNASQTNGISGARFPWDGGGGGGGGGGAGGGWAGGSGADNSIGGYGGYTGGFEIPPGWSYDFTAGLMSGPGANGANGFVTMTIPATNFTGKYTGASVSYSGSSVILTFNTTSGTYTA
jgi:hypothetical protein